MKIISLIRYEIKNSAKDLRILLLALLIPVLLIGISHPINAVMDESRQKTHAFGVAVVDYEDSVYSKMITSHLGNAPSLSGNVKFYLIKAEAAAEMLARNEIVAVITIPQNFISNLQAGNPLPLEIILNRQMPLQTSLIVQATESVTYYMDSVQNMLYGISRYTFLAGADSQERSSIFNSSMMLFFQQVLERDSIYRIEYLSPWESGNFIEFYIFSIFLFYICIIALYHGFRKTRQERGLFYERLITSGKSNLFAISLDIFSSGIIVFLQAALLFILIVIFQNMPWLSLIMLVFLLPISIGAVALIHLIMLFSRQNQAFIFVSVIVNGFALFVSGAIIPLTYMTSPLITALNQLKYIFPHYYWFKLLLRHNVLANPSLIEGSGFIFYGIITFVAAFVLVLLAAAGKKMR